MPDPIYDTAAERAVLGSILLSEGRVLPDVAAIVRPQDFYVPFHEVVYRAALDLAERSQPVDSITLVAALDPGELTRGGGAGVILDMLQDTPTASNVMHYARIVEDRATRRGLQRTAQRLAQLAESTDIGADTAVEMGRDELESVVRRTAGLHSLGDDMAEFASGFGTTLYGTRSPWGGLNDFIGGWVPGRLYTIGSRPGVGKTILGAQIAVEMARTGSVALSSVEMSRREITGRIASMLASVNHDRIAGLAPLDENDRRRLSLARRQAQSLPLFTDDRSHVMPVEIGSHARTVARRHPKLGGIIVDYMQLMGAPRRVESRQQEIADISRSLKLLARDLDVPVVALAQLNRDVERRQVKVPTLADLRESGAIEQDSDIVLLLSMEYVEDPTAPDGQIESDHVVRVTVAKNRHGRTGWFLLERQGEFSRMVTPRLGGDYTGDVP